MKLKDITKEELLLMSYTDIARMILKENKKTMNTPSIFKDICSLLGYSATEYADKIGDFYTSLTTDKRFVLLDSGEWDLKDNHVIPLIIDDEDDTEEPIEEDEIEVEHEEIEESEEDVLSESDEIDDGDDDLEDLSIVEEDENEIEES